jgi:hypothetical protein
VLGRVPSEPNCANSGGALLKRLAVFIPYGADVGADVGARQEHMVHLWQSSLGSLLDLCPVVELVLLASLKRQILSKEGDMTS